MPFMLSDRSLIVIQRTEANIEPTSTPLRPPYRSLRSAVEDALSFKDTLENHFGVPPDQIRTLLNSSASRSGILNAFRSLASDSRIQKGDPILIFYAGHGSEIPPNTKNHNAKIQVLVPQDYCSDAGKEVPAIPDRTIGALLSNIADSKGDNITVVFDCCHAASGTRSSQSEDPQVRSVMLTPTTKDQLADHEIWGGRSITTPKQFQHMGLRSHVLIAACASTETCREIGGHGLFSSAFLRLLRTCSPDKLRYSDILKHMDVIPGQNPQCEGVNQNRTLFNSMVLAPQRLCFDVTIGDSGKIILAGGAVHGIMQDAEFAIFKNAESIPHTPLGVCEVDTLSPFSATLKPSSFDGISFDGTGFALQIKAGSKEDMRLYIPPEEDMAICADAWISLMQRRRDFQNILLADSPEDAHVELRLENGKIVFIYRDPKITQHGLDRVLFGVEPEIHDLSRALESMAHFLWKLNLTNNNPEVMSSIDFEFYRLHEPDFDNDENQEMSPISPNLYQNGVVDFVVDDEPYGIKLVNNSEYDFYPYLFYFDNSDLSIAPYYESPSSGLYFLDVPLKANGGSLTIGYGTGGAAPFSYYLRYPQKIDVGYLKLFLCTQPVDLSNISQFSPFENSRGPVDTLKTTVKTWGTILVPVTQRRHPLQPETHCVQCGSISAKSLDLKQTTMIHNLEYKAEILAKEIDILHKSAAAEKEFYERELSELKIKLQGRVEGETNRPDPGPKESGHQPQEQASFVAKNHPISQPKKRPLSSEKRQRWSSFVKRFIHIQLKRVA
ncbi:hypothetical protein JR316_0010985 [Psilocybe cubensis]|uniref:Uncharacterized protein n=1 Tax=Psilocybe cubensis TaxID=181762 RepID=A0ACB8GNC8_PSICU|nr:hypothetical protein JR316_0010985 [Psilocybe cubensis]KAH9477069.1 hypothetical protein JR316_0010985 [Psilocybe cubensis]